MVSVPYQLVFLAFLGVYVLYSAGLGLNPRWPVYGALLLLVAAALAHALGASDAADEFALDAVFLLGAGVTLVAFDRWRRGHRSAAPVAAADPP
jgi:hypothetical protein